MSNSSLARALVIVLPVSLPTAASNFGDPFPGLTEPQATAFQAGKTVFMKIHDPENDGLGPVFNDVSCAACHAGPSGTAASGAVGGTNETMETRFGRLDGDVFDPLASEGGSLLRRHGIGPAIEYLPNPAHGQDSVPPGCEDIHYVGAVVPPDANVIAHRRTTPVFGLGLVDAVPDSTFSALRDSQPPDVRGIVNIAFNPDTGNNEVGKFGWKGGVPTLHMFAGAAYAAEMGITNPSFPSETCPHGDCSLLACNPFPNLNDNGQNVDRLANFMTMLGPPPRGRITAQVIAGEALFSTIGCATCHAPALQAGPSPIAAINNQVFRPYSDFLLHDMGTLGDGITQGMATGALMRTAPLWGLRTQKRLLHDGRATTLRQAINAHAGQGLSARVSFNALPALLQEHVLQFLRSL